MYLDWSISWCCKKDTFKMEQYETGSSIVKFMSPGSIYKRVGLQVKAMDLNWRIGCSCKKETFKMERYETGSSIVVFMSPGSIRGLGCKTRLWILI